MSAPMDGSTWANHFNVNTSLALISALLCISGLLFKSTAAASRLSKVGTRAPAVSSRFPFGFGVSFAFVYHIRNNTFLEWAQQILSIPGRTVEVSMVSNSIIITDNIENIRAIMSTQFDCFPKGELYHTIWSSLMRDSILTTDGTAWQANRNHLVAHTARIRPTDYAVTKRHTQHLIRVLSDGKPHDTLDQLNRFAIDVVSDIFYGTSTQTLVTNDQSLRDAIQRHKDVNTWRLAFGKIGAMIPPDQKACRVIDSYLDQLVDSFSLEDSDDLEERGRKAQTLLGVLAAQGVSEKILKDQLVAVLVGGRDSVAIAVTWALYELVRHPDVMRELRAEIAHRGGPSVPPDQSQIEDMEFLNGVVQETMRLHASVGFNVRTTAKDCSLPSGGGPQGTSPIGVLAGTTVVVGLDSVHRRTDLYGFDANEFKPHRWDNKWKPETWTFYPFGRGHRPCLGKNLAMMEVKFVLCRLLQTFGSIEMVEHVGNKVVLVKAEERARIRTKMAFNTKPAEPVWLRFRQ